MNNPSIAICTLFRDCGDDVLRIFRERLKAEYDQSRLTHICIEGDSVDNTYELLKRAPGRVIVEKVDTGKPKFGSVAEPDRLITLGRLWNRALDIAETEKTDYVFITDSDITFQPSVFRQLVAHRMSVIAPMFFFEKSVFFRDTWAYRGTDGIQFTNRPPYHSNYKRPLPFEVSSVGLPFMENAVVKAGVRCDQEEVVGLSRNIKALGFKIFVDPFTVSYHPRHGIEIPDLYEHR